MRRAFLLVILTLPICLSLAPRRPFLPGPELPANQPALTIRGELPSEDQFRQIACTDPIAMIEAALKRYEKEITSYQCVLVKQERVNGVLNPKEETIAANYREEPFSVAMRWLDGHTQADASLYVQGENDNNILVRPRGWRKRLLLNGYVALPVDDPRVSENSRYGIQEFGLRKGMERTYLAWKQARNAGHFRAEYLGLQPVEEVNGRLCHIWERHCLTPQEEGLTRARVAYDAETWLQVSSELWAGDDLIASYRFRDVELNPTIEADTFTTAFVERD